MNYKPGLKNMVPDALYRCIEESRKDSEVHKKIPSFESDTFMALNSSQKDKISAE